MEARASASAPPNPSSATSAAVPLRTGEADWVASSTTATTCTRLKLPASIQTRGRAMLDGQLSVTLPEGREMVMPGDNVGMDVILIQPIAMEKELRFAIREGGRTVGAGVVTEVVE